MCITKKILCLAIFCFSVNLAFSQVPVKDKKHRKWSKIMEEVQLASQAINTRVTAFVGNIKDVQEFMSKASMVVNGVVKNVQMVRKIIEVEKDIAKLVNQSIEIISSPRDTDGNGEDDFEFLDKWKHIQILLAISSEATNVFDLFKNVIEEDATIMDDKGRLTLIRDAYKDATRIRATIRAQLRRINKEVYQYRRLKKEIKIYEEFFSKSS
ncbi:MAG: hypothetical protein AB8G86_07120 [Saprospiraceae bacterium]